MNATKIFLEYKEIDDASRLNKTKVRDIVEVHSDKRVAKLQLQELIVQASREKAKISVAGSRYSMGGHVMTPEGIVLDLSSFNHMSLDISRNILKVGSGAIWRDVLNYLNDYGRSVAVMQSDYDFSVGGSISVNCHGLQTRTPPISSTVESFELLKPDGEVVICSRLENAELFSLALGGYSLFGVILEVELKVVANSYLRMTSLYVPVEEFPETYEKYCSDEKVEAIYGRLNIVPEELLQTAILKIFTRSTNNHGALKNELCVRPCEKEYAKIFRDQEGSDIGKRNRWDIEKVSGSDIDKIQYISRNELFNGSAAMYLNQSSKSTDILQEYFVDKERFMDFVEASRELSVKYNQEILNVTVRYVNKDQDTFLNYARENCISLVYLFVQKKSDEGEASMKAMTQELVDKVREVKGTYYLPYRLHASNQQFHKIYPKAKEFFMLKRCYDPEEIFQNNFYKCYGSKRRV